MTETILIIGCIILLAGAVVSFIVGFRLGMKYAGMMYGIFKSENNVREKYPVVYPSEEEKVDDISKNQRLRKARKSLAGVDIGKIAKEHI